MGKDSAEIKFNKKIWIETADGQNIFGDGKYKLLKTIEKTGSLKLAIEELGLSYRKTWDKLKKIEETLGFKVVDTTRGGRDGGSSQITPEGKILVHAFEKFHQGLDEFFNDLSKQIENEFFTELNK